MSLNQIFELARNKSADARGRLVDAVADFYFTEERSHTEREATLVSDILRQLIREVEVPVRRALAERLADRGQLPHDLALLLANDEIEIAYPVLVHSPVLRDPDLLEIIRARTMQHQMAVAMRPRLGESVANALIDTGNILVIQALLSNPDAHIGRPTLGYLVDQSRRFEPLQRPLVTRDDLPPDLVRQMYSFVSAALKQVILDRFQVNADGLEEALRAAVAIVEAGRKPPPRHAAESDWTPPPGIQPTVTPNHLVQALRTGDVALFEALFARMVGITVTLVHRLLSRPDGAGLAVACRAVDIPKPVFAPIFLLSRRARPGEHVVAPDEVSRMLSLYDRLTREDAASILATWRRNPELAAAWRSNGAKVATIH